MDFVRYLQIAALALIQGAAELLPVSSSAHVILAQRVMGMDPSQAPQVFLLVMLHTGTMFAVIVYFWPRWRRMLSTAAPRSHAPALEREFPTPERGSQASGDHMERWHFLMMIVLATACTGVLGLVLKVLIEQVILERLLGYPKGEVEELFKHLPLIAAALA